MNEPWTLMDSERPNGFLTRAPPLGLNYSELEATFVEKKVSMSCNTES